MTPEATTAEPKTVRDLFEVFASFDRDRNNKKTQKSLDWTMMHTHSEISEIWDAIRKNEPRVRVVEEVADAVNMTLIIAHRLGITPDELMAACHQKLVRMSYIEGERPYV